MFIAITTYGSPENVYYQVMNMYDKKHTYYIHYNRRDPKKNLKKLKQMFAKYNNVHVISKYKVYWGEISIVKSMLNMLKIFSNSNEDHFIHLGTKEINIKPINEIEKILQNSSNVNYMNFYGNYILDFCISRNSFFDYYNIHSEIFYRRNFKNNLYRYSSEKKLFFYFVIIWNIFLGLFSKNCLKILKSLVVIIWNIFLSLFSKNCLKILESLTENKKEIYKNIFYFMDDNNEVQNSFNLQFSRRIKKIPKKLKEFEFIARRQVGPILILNKNEYNKIFNNNLWKILFRYSKKCLAPEEFFFHSLYFNIIKDNKISRNPLAQNEMENQPGFISKNYNANDFLFLRRIVGKSAIKRVAKNPFK